MFDVLKSSKYPTTSLKFIPFSDNPHQQQPWIFDSDTPVTRKEGGRHVWICPFYRAWNNMRARCKTGGPYQRRYPSYIGCTVVTEWHRFSGFKVWMETQDWVGKQLDKDIILPGNKLYGPDTCMFASQSLNLLLNDSEAARGAWPIGVYWHKRCRKFGAGINIHGRSKHLGYFTDPTSAHYAYLKARIAYINEFIRAEIDPRIRQGLRLHIIDLTSQLDTPQHPQLIQPGGDA